MPEVNELHTRLSRVRELLGELEASAEAMAGEEKFNPERTAAELLLAFSRGELGYSRADRLGEPAYGNVVGLWVDKRDVADRLTGSVADRLTGSVVVREVSGLEVYHYAEDFAVAEGVCRFVFGVEPETVK